MDETKKRRRGSQRRNDARFRRHLSTLMREDGSGGVSCSSEALIEMDHLASFLARKIMDGAETLAWDRNKKSAVEEDVRVSFEMLLVGALEKGDPDHTLMKQAEEFAANRVATYVSTLPTPSAITTQTEQDVA
jgi:hypothetical protein